MYTSSTIAREELGKARGKSMSRQVYGKIHALMVKAGHAEESTNGKGGNVRCDALPIWKSYVKHRQRMILSGDWSHNRPYMLEDIECIVQR